MQTSPSKDEVKQACAILEDENKVLKEAVTHVVGKAQNLVQVKTEEFKRCATEVYAQCEDSKNAALAKQRAHLETLIVHIVNQANLEAQQYVAEIIADHEQKTIALVQKAEHDVRAELIQETQQDIANVKQEANEQMDTFKSDASNAINPKRENSLKLTKTS